ncbi:MAG: CHAT domain-containing protein, partial [Cyanobacteria bacterium P01_D01_bin.2]
NRAFLYAGTPNVLATLWPISDEATAELMEQFYGFLQRGETTAKALQLAQQAIKEDYPHPYYWAAFGLTGRGS